MEEDNTRTSKKPHLSRGLSSRLGDSFLHIFQFGSLSDPNYASNAGSGKAELEMRTWL